MKTNYSVGDTVYYLERQAVRSGRIQHVNSDSLLIQPLNSKPVAVKADKVFSSVYEARDQLLRLYRSSRF